MKKTIYILIISILFLSPVSAQKKLSREQLIADADTLYAQMYDIHPDLFAVYPQAEFEKGLTEAKTQFRDSMTAIDFYRLITPLIVNLGDGHTTIRIPGDLIDKEKAVTLPFNIAIDKKDYSVNIKDNYSDVDIPAGSEILSINGRGTKEILDRFVTYASGESNLFRLERVKQVFSLLPYIIYGDTTFTVNYQSEDEKNAVFVKSIKLGEFRKAAQETVNKERREAGRDFTLSLDNDISTAIIDFRSFSDLNRFTSFLDSTFTIIKDNNIKNLIIDLRKNGGGNSRLGDELFQYISPVPFQQFGRSQVKISPTLRRIFNDTIATLGMNVYEGSLYELRENDKRFTGNCYLLTSNHTFSSAAKFAWTFHYFNVGKIIGEETGGLIVTFGDMAGSTLPNTGIRFGVSWKKFYGYGADDSYTHGVRPDYEVPVEEAMDYAIELIKNRKLQK